MRTFTRGLLVAACTVAVLGLGAGAAQAQQQIPFLIDHYLVYPIVDPGSVGVSATLTDQLGARNHVITTHDKFANPVLKTIDPEVPPPWPGSLFYPQTHLSWWKIDKAYSVWQIITVSNQFGRFEWEIRDAQYLLVPARKFGVPFELNQHYKCYDATDEKPVDVDVNLADQFGISSTSVLFPAYFCNPVAKAGPQVEDSGPPPLPTDHLACYDIVPAGDPTPVIVEDQLSGPDPHVLANADLLCVPARKRLDVPVLSPWGLLAFGVLLTGAMYATIRRRGASLKA
jgi:hypothetical protein